MSVCPKTDKLVCFIEQATLLAEGKHQNKLVQAVAQQTADIIFFADNANRWKANLCDWLEGEVRETQQMVEQGESAPSKPHEGREDAYTRTLSFIKGK